MYRYMLPSQQHMYMEPHVSVAEPDEDGTISVWSSTQSPDACQKAVANVLGLPYHNVRVSESPLRTPTPFWQHVLHNILWTVHR